MAPVNLTTKKDRPTKSTAFCATRVLTMLALKQRGQRTTTMPTIVCHAGKESSMTIKEALRLMHVSIVQPGLTTTKRCKKDQPCTTKVRTAIRVPLENSTTYWEARLSLHVRTAPRELLMQIQDKRHVQIATEDNTTMRLALKSV